MTLLVTSDVRVQRFLEPFLTALECKLLYFTLLYKIIFLAYLSQKVLRRMIVAIADTKTQEILERWVFEIKEDDVNKYDFHFIF